MLDDQMPDVGQFVTPKASIVCERHRVKPELGVRAGVSHVDVRRFPPFETVEVEAVPANSQQRRHRTSLSCNLPPLPGQFRGCSEASRCDS